MIRDMASPMTWDRTHPARQRLADVVPGLSGNDEQNWDQAQNGESGELRRARHEVNGVESVPIGAWRTGSDSVESN